MITRTRKLAVSLMLAAAVFGATGCTPEKAKALEAAAVQFRVESLTCIDMIDELRARELQAPPRPRTEATAEFVEGVLEYDGFLTPDTIQTFADPFEVPGSRLDDSAWGRARAGLRAQYSEFAAMYDQLAAGSYLASEAVERSKDIVVKLTAQLIAFARAIDQNPPILIQYRSALITDLERIRASNLSSQQKAEAVAPYLERWESIKAQEAELGNTTVTQCLKAALLGKEVRTLADRYKELSLDDINTIVATSLGYIGTLSGRDMTGISNQVSETIAAIQSDPEWNALAGSILDTVNSAAQSRNPGSETISMLPTDAGESS